MLYWMFKVILVFRVFWGFSFDGEFLVLLVLLEGFGWGVGGGMVGRE